VITNDNREDTDRNKKDKTSEFRNELQMNRTGILCKCTRELHITGTDGTDITLHSLDPKLVKMTVGYGTSHTNIKTQ
jgi:hypothetical protein